MAANCPTNIQSNLGNVTISHNNRQHPAVVHRAITSSAWWSFLSKQPESMGVYKSAQLGFFRKLLDKLQSQPDVEFYIDAWGIGMEGETEESHKHRRQKFQLTKMVEKHLTTFEATLLWCDVWDDAITANEFGNAVFYIHPETQQYFNPEKMERNFESISCHIRDLREITQNTTIEYST